MDENNEGRLVKWIDGLNAGIIIAVTLSVGLGLFSVGSRFFSYLSGNGWPHRSASAAFGLESGRIFSGDVAWWLLLFIPFILLALSGYTDDIRKWAVLRHTQSREGEMKTMSGWRRLWIVLSIIFGLAAGSIDYFSNKRLFQSFEATQEKLNKVPPVMTMIGGAPILSSLKGDALFWEAVRREIDLTRCAAPAHAEPSYGGAYWISCPLKRDLVPTVGWALLPALIMAAAGLTCRWIYRGFRGQPKARGSG
jgi:hypothetical protein